MPADGPYVCTTPFESHRIRSGASLSHTTAGVIDPGEVVQVSGTQTCSSGNVWVKVPGGWSLFTNNTGDAFFKAKEVAVRTKNPAPETKRSKQSRPRTEAAASALPDAKRVARHAVLDEPTTPVKKETESPEDVAASLAAMKPTTPLRDLPGTYDLGTPANGKSKAAAIVHHRFNLCDYADTDSFNDDLDTVCDLLDGFCSEQLGYTAERSNAGRTKLSAVALKEEDLRPVLRVLAKLTGEGVSTPAVDFATPTRASTTVLRCVALLAEAAALFIPGFEALSNQVLANILKAGHRSSAVVCAYLPAIFAPFLSEDTDTDADASENADDSQRRSSTEPTKLSMSRFEPVLNVVKSVYFAAPSSPLPAPGKRGTKRAERAQAAFQVSGIVDVLCSVLYATLPHLIPRSVAHYSPSTSLSRGYKACSGVAARLVSSLLLDSTLLCVVAPSTGSKAVCSAAEHGQKFVAVCNELIARLLTADACASNMLLSTTVSQLLSGYIQPALKTDGNEDNFSGVSTDERNVVLCCALEVLSNVSQQTKLITSRAKDVRPGVAVSVVEGDALPVLTTAPPSAAAAAALLQSLGGAESLAERFSIGDLRHRVLPALGVYEAAERKAEASAPRKGAKGGTKRRRTDREEERLLEEYGDAKETAAAEVSGTELEQEEKELERLDNLPNKYEVLTDEQIERIDAAKEKCVEKVAQKMDVYTVLGSSGPLGNSKVTKQQLTSIASRLGVKVAKSLNKEELAAKLVAHCEKQAAAEKKASKNGTADTPQLAGLAYTEIDRTACDLSNLLQGETAGRRGFFVLTWGAHFTDTAQAAADKAISTEAARHAAAKVEAVRAMAAVERYLPAKEWHFQQELHRICGRSFVPAEDEPAVAEDAERGGKKAKKQKKEEEEDDKQRADCVGLFLFLCTQTLEAFAEGADARGTRAVLCGRERAVGVIDSYKLVVRHIVLLFGSQKPSANAVVRKKAAAEIEALIAVDVGLVEDVWGVMRSVFYSKATGAFQPPPTLHEAYYDMLLLVAQKAHLLESYKFCTDSQTALPDGSTEKLLDHILHIGLNTLCRGTTVAVGNGAAAAPNAGVSLVVSKKVKKLLCCLITGRSHGQPSSGSAGCANPAAKKQVLSFVVRVLSEKLAEAGGGSAIVPLDFDPAVVTAYFDPELYTKRMNSACADQMYLMRVCLSPDDESEGTAKPAGGASAGAGLFLYLLKQTVLRGNGVGGDVSETPLAHDVVPAEEGRILTALMPFLIMLGGGAAEQSGNAPSPTLDGNVVRSVAALLQEFLAAFNGRRDAAGSAAVPGTPPRSFTYSDERGASGQTDSVHSLDDTHLLQGTAAEVLASASCSLLLFCVRLLTGALTHVVLCQVLKRRGGSGRTSPPASPLTPPRRRKGEKEKEKEKAKTKEAACRPGSPPLHTKEALPPQQELSCDADVVFLKDVLSPAALEHVVAGVVAFAENKVDSNGRVVLSTPDELLGFIHGIRILLQLVPFNFEGFFEGKGETTSCGAVVTALQTVLLMYARQYQNRILKLTATALSMVSVLRLRECGRQQPPLVYFAPASYSISGASSSLYTCYIAGANMTLSLRVFSKVFTTILTVFLPQIEKGASTPQHVARAQQFTPHLCRGLYLVSLFVEAFDWTRRSLVAFLSDAVKRDEPAGAHNMLLGGKGVLHNVYKLLTETLRVVNIPLPADAPGAEKVALAELRSKALAMVLKVLKALCGQNATVYFKASQNLIATCIGVDSMQAAVALKCDGANQASLPVLTTTELRAAALSLLYEFLAGEEKKLLEGSRHADGEATGTCAGPATSTFHLMKTPEKMHPEKRNIDQDSGVGSSLMHRFLPVVQHAMFSTDGRVRGLAQTLMQLCFDQGLSVPHLSLDFIIAANDAASNHTHRIAYDTDCYDLFRGEGGGKKARLHEAPVDTCAAKPSIPTTVVPAYLLSSFSFNSRTAKEYASLLASKICAAVQKKFIYCHYTCGVESVGRLRGVVSRQGSGVLESQISMELYLASQQSAAGGHGGVGLVTQLLRMLAQQDAVRRWMRGLRAFYHTVKLTDTDGVPGGAPATSSFPPLLLLNFPRFVGEAVSTLTVKKETHLQQMLDVANQGLLLELEELQTHVARLLGLTAAESDEESDDSGGDGVPKAKRAKTAARAKGAAAARKAKAEAQRLAAEENVAKAGPEGLLEVCVRGLCVVVLYELALWWKRSKGSAGGDAEDAVKADVSFTVPLSSAAYKTFLANIDKAASFHNVEGDAVSVTSDNLRALLTTLQAISLDDKFLSSVAANGPKGAKRKPRAKPAKQPVQRRKKKAAESSDEDSDDTSTAATSSDESSDNDTSSSSSSSASSAKKPAVRRRPAAKKGARQR